MVVDVDVVIGVDGLVDVDVLVDVTKVEGDSDLAAPSLPPQAARTPSADNAIILVPRTTITTPEQ
jgi:hypothetical protein